MYLRRGHGSWRYDNKSLIERGNNVIVVFFFFHQRQVEFSMYNYIVSELIVINVFSSGRGGDARFSFDIFVFCFFNRTVFVYRRACFGAIDPETRVSRDPTLGPRAIRTGEGKGGLSGVNSD